MTERISFDRREENIRSGFVCTRSSRAYYTCFVQMSKRAETVPAIVSTAGVVMVIAIIMVEPFPGVGKLRSRCTEKKIRLNGGVRTQVVAVVVH